MHKKNSSYSEKSTRTTMLKPNLSSENEEKIHSVIQDPDLISHTTVLNLNKRRVSPYNAIWWWRQQTLRKLMKNMTRKS